MSVTDAIQEDRCFFCWDVSFEKKKYNKSIMTKIYASCARHLDASMMGNSKTNLPLEELEKGTHEFNKMCSSCLQSINVLSEINSRLEAIEKEVVDFVDVFTDTALKLRKANGRSGPSNLRNEMYESVTNEASKEFKDPDAEPEDAKSPNEFIHIKSEADQDYEPEDVTDYFSFDDENESGKQLEPTTDPLSIDNNSTSTSGHPDSDEVIDSVENQKSPTEKNQKNDETSFADKLSDVPIVPDLEEDVEVISVQCNIETPAASPDETYAVNSMFYNHFERPPIEMTQLNCSEFCSDSRLPPPYTGLCCSKVIDRDKINNGLFNQFGHGNQLVGANMQANANMIHKCYLCGETFSNEQPLFLHLELYHKIVVPFQRNGNSIHLANNSKSFNPNNFPIRHPSQNYMSCNMCFSAFPSAQMLHSHQKQCFSQRPGNNPSFSREMLFNCELCPSSFRTVADLRIHVCTIHDIPLHCELCQMAFNDPHKLEIHMLSHNAPVICYHCQTPFPNIQQLNIHIEKFHLTPPLYNNNVNSNPNSPHSMPGRVTNINASSPIQDNSNTHANVSGNRLRYKPFRCLICAANFDKIGELTKHSLVHPDVSVNKAPYRLFVCEICGECYRTIVEHVAHTKIHSTAKRVQENCNLFRCTNCEKSFNSKFELTSHQVEHVAQRKFYCHRCCNAFPSEDELVLHKEQIHSDNEEFPFCKCNICGVIFKDITELAAHTKIESQGSNNVQIQFKCCICNAIFRTNAELSSHQNIHNRAKLHCSLCNLEFFNHLEFANHNLTYHRGISGSEIQSCGPCPPAVPFESNSKAHQNSAHRISLQPNISPNTCNICKMPFMENTNIKCHYRLCSKLRDLRKNLRHFDQDLKRFDVNNKTHKCYVCNKSFHHMPTLKFHLITHRKPTAPISK